jgi:addiction module HigA family antidote
MMVGSIRVCAMTDDNKTFDYPGDVPPAPVHPGKTLASELAARKLTANALALRLRVSATRLSEILHGKRAISAETALRLGRYFGTGGTFWINLQAQYDLALAERELGAKIAKEVEAPETTMQIADRRRRTRRAAFR